MSADLSEAGWERSTARSIVRSLSAWQKLDIALVERQGFMRVGRVYPTGGTGRLIGLRVLTRPTETQEGCCLLPDENFIPVVVAIKSLERGGADG